MIHQCVTHRSRNELYELYNDIDVFAALLMLTSMINVKNKNLKIRFYVKSIFLSIYENHSHYDIYRA